MSWLTVFFRRDSVKVILKLGEKLLKIVLGKVASNVQEIAAQEVSRAEASGKTGVEKYEAAFKGVKARFPEMKESFINFAIETAVVALGEAKR